MCLLEVIELYADGGGARGRVGGGGGGERGEDNLANIHTHKHNHT